MGASWSTSGSFGSMSRSEQNLNKRCSCARRQICTATPRVPSGTCSPPVRLALALPSSRFRSSPSRISVTNARRRLDFFRRTGGRRSANRRRACRIRAVRTGAIVRPVDDEEQGSIERCSQSAPPPRSSRGE
jgi:hypothetical protein